MKKLAAAALAGISLVMGSVASHVHAASNADHARAVAERLDVLSFANSIYSRSRPGAHTLADYGFTRFDSADGGVRAIDPARHWIFGVKIVEDNGGIKVLCIQDESLSASGLFGQSTIEVKLGRDGLFHGTGRTPENAQCPPYPRQSEEKRGISPYASALAMP